MYRERRPRWRLSPSYKATRCAHIQRPPLLSIDSCLTLAPFHGNLTLTPENDLTIIRVIGLQRLSYGQIVLDIAVPPLLQSLAEVLPDKAGPTDKMPARTTVNDGSSEGGAAVASTRRDEGLLAVSVEHSLSALVELSDMPRVFAVAAPGMLAGEARVIRCEDVYVHISWRGAYIN